MIKLCILQQPLMNKRCDKEEAWQSERNQISMKVDANRQSDNAEVLVRLCVCVSRHACGAVGILLRER